MPEENKEEIIGDAASSSKQILETPAAPETSEAAGQATEADSAPGLTKEEIVAKEESKKSEVAAKRKKIIDSGVEKKVIKAKKITNGIIHEYSGSNNRIITDHASFFVAFDESGLAYVGLSEEVANYLAQTRNRSCVLQTFNTSDGRVHTTYADLERADVEYKRSQMSAQSLNSQEDGSGQNNIGDKKNKDGLLKKVSKFLMKW